MATGGIGTGLVCGWLVVDGLPARGLRLALLAGLVAGAGAIALAIGDAAAGAAFVASTAGGAAGRALVPRLLRGRR